MHFMTKPLLGFNFPSNQFKTIQKENYAVGLVDFDFLENKEVNCGCICYKSRGKKSKEVNAWLKFKSID